MTELMLNDLDLLTEVSKMLTSFDQTRVLKNVIDLLMRSFEVEESLLLMSSDDSSNWRHFSLRPQFKTAILRMPVSEDTYKATQRIISEGLARWVIQHKQGTIVADTATDDRWLNLPDLSSDAGSVLCVPFIQDDKVIGVFTLQHPKPGHFIERHLRLMTIIANQVSIAMRNSQLFAQMQSQQKQLEAVLHAMPDVLLVLDNTGHLILVNDAAAELLKSTRDVSAIGHPLREFRHADSTLAMVIDIVDSPLQTGQNWSFEVHSDELKRDYLANISIWEQQKGVANAGYVVVMRDITQMRDLNRFKDEMLQMASHDLRSPLALIVGYCSLMQLDIEPESKIAEYLGIVQQQTERMTGLLDDLLRVEKIRTSPTELYERAEFRDIVNTALNNMRPAADAKGQRLSASLQLDSTPPLLVNPALVREAMENLISNAVKYTPSGGKIAVKAYQEAKRVHFIVEDNGIGIPADMLPRLFNSFFRARQPGTEDIEGRGLGLSLVKSIIERHKGEVWVESTVGTGSRFGFWLPIT